MVHGPRISGVKDLAECVYFRVKIVAEVYFRVNNPKLKCISG